MPPVSTTSTSDRPQRPPRQSAGAAPPCPPGALRRTTTLDVTWPQGRGGDARIEARGRDWQSADDGHGGDALCEQACIVQLRPDRSIASIETQPPRSEVAGLIGASGGGGLRKAIAAAVPEERASGSILHLLLDDLAGVSLVAGWSWSQWDPDWQENSRRALQLKDVDLEKAFRDRAGICAGFAEGSSGLDPNIDRTSTPTVDLRNARDPDGWHAFPDVGAQVSLRRARRIDVSASSSGVKVDSAFQDSATHPDGVRRVVHEYRLIAEAFGRPLQLSRVEALPCVLPFVECRNAAGNLDRLLGTPLSDLRSIVLEQLRGAVGCTHLNDALRALADVPMLVPDAVHALRRD